MTFEVDSSSFPSELAKISSKEAFGGALASPVSSPPPLSSSDFGDLTPLGADTVAPNRVVPLENDPKASLGLGIDAFGTGDDPNTGGLPGAGEPKPGPAGVGEALEEALRNGEGLDAKEANPPDAKFGFGDGELVREGDFGVEYFASSDGVPPKAEKPDCWGEVSGSRSIAILKSDSPTWRPMKTRRGMIWMVRLLRKEMDQSYRRQSHSTMSD